MTLNDRMAAAGRGVWQRLFEPIDIASLVFFRVAFGLLMVVEVCRYFAHGWIERHFIRPVFHFKYYGFEWVEALPGNGMYAVFVIIGILSLCIALGFKYRLAAALFFVFFTYVFLIDQARYLNHFYLICLIGFLLIFVPAHRSFSIDARLSPALRSRTVPRWALWILRAELTIMYVYGGIAKIDGDWLRGSPMDGMLARNATVPWVGPYLTDPRVVLLFAWGGMLFDLFIVPLVLWRRTRWFALAWAASFHGINQFMFDIGVFPSFAMAGTLLFLPADWPRRVIARFRKGKEAASAAPAPPPKQRARKKPAQPYSKPAVAVLGAFFFLQIFLPLRHFLYPGNASWTDEGQRFAWRMMLRAKRANGRFIAVDRFTKMQQGIYPARYLDREQLEIMWLDPDMIVQFAHFTEEQLLRQGWQVPEVRTSVHASLNGRRAQLLVDPNVNLAAESRTLLPKKWILPLTEPLPDAKQRAEMRGETPRKRQSG